MKMHLLVTILMLLSPSLFASEVKLPDTKITIHAQNSGTRDIIDTLFSQSNLKYKISNDITNKLKLSVDVKEAKWSDVFDFVIKKSKLKYSTLDDGTIIVSENK